MGPTHVARQAGVALGLTQGNFLGEQSLRPSQDLVHLAIQSDLNLQRMLHNAMLMTTACTHVSQITSSAVEMNILRARQYISRAINIMANTDVAASNVRERYNSVTNVHAYDDRAAERRTQVRLSLHQSATVSDYEQGACYVDPARSTCGRTQPVSNRAPAHERMDGWQIKRAFPNTMFKSPRHVQTRYTYRHNDGPGYCHPEEKPVYECKHQGKAHRGMLYSDLSMSRESRVDGAGLQWVDYEEDTQETERGSRTVKFWEYRYVVEEPQKKLSRQWDGPRMLTEGLFVNIDIERESEVEAPALVVTFQGHPQLRAHLDHRHWSDRDPDPAQYPPLVANLRVGGHESIFNGRQANLSPAQDQAVTYVPRAPVPWSQKGFLSGEHPAGTKPDEQRTGRWLSLIHI